MKRCWIVAASMVALLSACSGGSSSITGAPSPGPTGGSPTPTASPSDFETQEYFGSGALDIYALDLLGASSAYAAGGTGQGQTVAVIDSGVDFNHPDLDGQISSLSIDLFDTQRGDLLDPDGHGTFVAGLIAAERDGAGMHGLAFDSELLIVRTDRPGSCEDGECLFFASDIVRAVDYAVSQGADVINLSLGGLSVESALITDALERAVDAGVIIVGAAGNGGNPQPDQPAGFAALPSADGLALAVGAIDENGNQAGFSNRAGSTANYYLLAPGVDVTSTILTSTPECAGNPRCYGIGDGTSFAAPYVAASLALLLDAFPNISPEQAVEILLETAEDLGVTGPDATFGAGIVDLREAFRPQGATSVSFRPLGATPHDLSMTAPIGAVFAEPTGAFGDWAWASGAFDGVIARDSYDRAFTINAPAPTQSSSSLRHFAAAAEALRQTTQAANTPFGSAALRLADRPYNAFANIRADEDMERDALSARFEFGQFGFSMGQGAARSEIVRPGLSASALSLTAWSGAANLTEDADWRAMDVDMGDWRFAIRDGADESGQLHAATVARRWGEHWLSLEAGESANEDAVLGSSVLSRLGEDGGANTSFLASGWSGPVAGPWRGAARFEYAHIALPQSFIADLRDEPTATSWAFGIERSIGDAGFGLTLWQPMRAETGALSMEVPVATTSDAVGTLYETRLAALTPSGREVSLEAALNMPLASALDVTLAARLAREPGHIASAQPEAAFWFGLRSSY